MFIVPGVCQFTVKGTYQGRNVANVLHYFIDTTGSTKSRETACFEMAGVVINQWKADMMTYVGNAYTFTEVSWVDLDSANGTVGSRTQTATTTLPFSGAYGTSGMPGNVSILVRKNLNGRRGVRKGRIYIVGAIESDTAASLNNTLSPTMVTNWQTKVTNFHGNSNQTDQGPLEYNARMCIAHILTREPPPADKPWLPGNPLTGEAIEVNSLSVDATLATQRRRLRG